MQTRICPECSDDIYINAKSHKCGWRLVAEKTIGRVVQHRLPPDEKAAYELGGPRSKNLTEAQWVAVCRFWPTVAARCSRPMATADHALWNTVRQGPLTRHMRSRERQPGEDDV